MKRLFIFALSIPCFWSCTYRKGDIPTPITNDSVTPITMVAAACGKADTLNVSYANDIHPILTANCIECHDNTKHFGGIQIEAYSDVKAEANTIYSQIIPMNGFPPYMPLNGHLTACQMNLIRLWIKQGLKNN